MSAEPDVIDPTPPVSANETKDPEKEGKEDPDKDAGKKPQPFYMKLLQLLFSCVSTEAQQEKAVKDKGVVEDKGEKKKRVLQELEQLAGSVYGEVAEDIKHHHKDPVPEFVIEDVPAED